MYGKLTSSPADLLLVSLSPASDGLHDNTIFIIVRSPNEHEHTVVKVEIIWFYFFTVTGPLVS